MAASMVRDEMPWLYELALEVYRVVKVGDTGAIEREITRLSRLSEMIMRGPLLEMMGYDDKESDMFARELPRILEARVNRRV